MGIHLSNIPKQIGSGIWIDPRVNFGKNVTIGHCSCIGYPEDKEMSCEISDDVNIGAFCIISMGVILEKKVSLEHYCRIDGKTRIGENTQLLYGARVHYNVTIGRDCIINGNCVDRTKIGNRVRHFGRLMHMQTDASSDWETTDEPSPEIGDDVFIGGNALVVGGVKIGKGVRIGANAIVYGNGLEIGEGVKIGPAEIVKQNLPSYSKFYDGKTMLDQTKK